MILYLQRSDEEASSDISDDFDTELSTAQSGTCLNRNTKIASCSFGLTLKSKTFGHPSTVL